MRASQKMEERRQWFLIIGKLDVLLEVDPTDTDVFMQREAAADELRKRGGVPPECPLNQQLESA